MPDETSSPDPNHPKPPAPKSSGAMGGLVQAERLFQIAIILPVSVVVGWAIGAGLDKWLHQHWIYLPGLILGCVAGFIEVFRLIQQNSGDGR
ncbi:MAG: AtpZ/AtpI family protein [Acidobacteriaceae bacterium]